MHHVGALDGGIGRGAGELGVEAGDRRGLGDIERLALGNALDDVEQDDVAEFLEAGEMGERAADLPGADERDRRTGHGLRDPLRGCGIAAERAARLN